MEFWVSKEKRKRDVVAVVILVRPSKQNKTKNNFFDAGNNSL